MELLQLRYFCDAAGTENFSRTAKKFYVPASNISQSVKRLERELGVPLFDRSANRIRLNETGRSFLREVEAALSLIDAAAEAARQNRREIIRVDICLGRRVVMEVIERFGREHPDIGFVTSHTADGSTGAFDIVVTDKKLDIPYLCTAAAEEALLLACREDVFDVETLSLRELPFVTMNSGSSLYEHTLRICAALGFSPRIALQGEDPHYIRKCVELGLGVAIVPELSWRHQFSEAVTLKPLGDFKRQIRIYRRPGESAALERFHAELLRAFGGNEEGRT